MSGNERASYEELEAQLAATLDRLSEEGLSIDDRIELIEQASETALRCIEALDPA